LCGICGGLYVPFIQLRVDLAHELSCAEHVQKPSELHERRAMVVNPQVDDPIAKPRRASKRFGNHDCGCLHAARVAASGLTCIQGVEQPFGQRPFRGFERTGHGLNDFRASQNVALRTEIQSGVVPFPIEGGSARPCGRAPRCVEDRDLTIVASLVAAEHQVERLLR
jgi:hypothetical protein